ncbi:MAG: peptidylprolyl isomerase [Alphaproteobacteria bacterium]|nr:peptidylprolyl isomerase [Alphaproteobacteria bacterium]
MSEAKSGDTVRIHYTGTLTDGTRFDSSEGRDPLEFTLGGGQIIPGLEREILGMKVGDKKTVTAVADEAYGQPNPTAMQEVPRSSIPPEIELVVGGQLQAMTQDGRQISVTIAALTDDTVTMDANHPLAGKDLIFDVELVEIV